MSVVANGRTTPPLRCRYRRSRAPGAAGPAVFGCGQGVAVAFEPARCPFGFLADVREDRSRNFGERYDKDAYGRVIDATPRVVVLHETVVP